MKILDFKVTLDGLSPCQGDSPGQAVHFGALSKERFQCKMRLDKALAGALKGQGISRAKVQSLIKQGLVAVNGQVCRSSRAQIVLDDLVTAQLPELSCQTKPIAGQLKILCQDQGLVVLDKPWGVSVHPAPSEKGPTLVNYMLARFPGLQALDPVRPGVVHRLDKDTSGVLVWALDEEVRQTLAASFAQRKVRKEYLALVHGQVMPAQGEIALPLSRDQKHKTRMGVHREGRFALTRYRSICSLGQGKFSLVHLEILTGRTHQIRVHLAHLGHPVVGDQLYGPAHRAELFKTDPLLSRLVKRQLLHAWRIVLTHPLTGEILDVRCPLPLDFCQALFYVARKVMKVIFLAGEEEPIVPAGKWPVLSLSAVEKMLWAPGGPLTEMCQRTFGERFLDQQRGVLKKKDLLCFLRSADRVAQVHLAETFQPAIKSVLSAFWGENFAKRGGIAVFPDYLGGFLEGLTGDLDFVLGQGKWRVFWKQVQALQRRGFRNLLSELALYLPERFMLQVR